MVRFHPYREKILEILWIQADDLLSDKYQPVLANAGAIPILVELLDSDNEVLVMLSGFCLSNLALLESNQVAIAKYDAIPKAAKILSTSDNKDVLHKLLRLTTNLSLHRKHHSDFPAKLIRNIHEGQNILADIFQVQMCINSRRLECLEQFGDSLSPIKHMRSSCKRHKF